MKQLTINVTFRGGLGFLRFVVFKGGHQVQNIVFENSSEKTVLLYDGLYLFSGTGVSPHDGTEIAFSESTFPSTPDAIIEGPIFCSYSLTIQ